MQKTLRKLLILQGYLYKFNKNHFSETNEIFLVECPGGKRTREVLETIIVNNVEVGTKIITDGWTAYQHLGERGNELLNNK